MDNPAAWHPDPTGRHQLRYWDGQDWTEHVSDQGVQAIDTDLTKKSTLDKIDDALSFGNRHDPAKIQQQVGDISAANIGSGGGTLFTEPILVVNQKVKLIELNNQYSVFDSSGRQIASVNQVGQSTAKKLLRLVSSLDQYLTHKLEISDTKGQVLLRLTRPAKVFKSTVIVSDGADREVGRIVQENMIGKINFSLQVGRQQIGAIKAENWRAWDFRIEDASGTEVARITKKFEGIAKTLFTTADNYVLNIHQPLEQPLISLVVGAALSIDTALKQDARGLG
ncbi:MAG: phospholipid scramblase-related protein [Actinobacteria bacterium]|nr:phospholipid scramblase-related protein [Actinomycetota bacterium]